MLIVVCELGEKVNGNRKGSCKAGSSIVKVLRFEDCLDRVKRRMEVCVVEGGLEVRLWLCAEEVFVFVFSEEMNLDVVFFVEGVIMWVSVSSLFMPLVQMPI